MTVGRTEATFLLPRQPRTAQVFGALDDWRRTLAATGVDVDAEQPELAVTDANGLAHAVASGAPLVLVEGMDATRRLQGHGLHARAALVLPGLDTPQLFIPLRRPAVAHYAIRNWAVPTQRWKLARNGVVATLLGRGVFPGRRLITVAAREVSTPGFLTAARALGVPPDADWFLMPAQGDLLSRGAFHIFEPGESAPRWLLKFARVRGYGEPFDRDERGLRLAAEAGEVATRHAPAFLGRVEHAGLQASLETAATGKHLTGYLHSTAPRAEKLATVERIADWIVRLGVATASPAESRGAERSRLEREVLPRFPAAAPGLAAAVERAAGVLQHNDLGSWNVIVDGSAFTAVDWESARRPGPPLWDLLYFLGDALANLDGATGLAALTEHFVRLFRGELGTSDVLFKWTRTAAGRFELDAETVAELATLGWLHHGMSYVPRSETLRSYDASAARARTLSERVPELWLGDPALGPTWSAWRA